VSIYPRDIKFKIITLSPGRWFLPAGNPEEPSVLTIGPSSWWRDVGLDQPLLEIVQPSVQVAESLVKDYLNGMFACNMGNSMPGLFFVPGEFDVEGVRRHYSHMLEAAVVTQTNYWRTLLKYADALWARSNGNPLTINDEMRMAAKILGAKDKDWMKDHQNQGMVRCFACGSFKHPDYAICQSCHTADPEHPKYAEILRARQAANMTTAQANGPFQGLKSE